jgi:hypothetical protein
MGAKAMLAAASQRMPRQTLKKRLEGRPIGVWVAPILVEI